MKFSSILIGVVAASYEQEWQEFQEKQGFRNGEIPEAFKATVDLVKAHNAKNSDYKLTYTGPFAAMTQEQYKMRQGLRPLSDADSMPDQKVHVPTGLDIADSVDWTTKGVVTPVKDQGQCGSCWSFSVTGAVEGQWALATNDLPSLSEQFFVDCARPAGNMGCSGGFMNRTIAWAVSQWLPTEDSYPYIAKGRKCISGGWDVAISKGQVTGVVNVPDEDALLDAVANVGPISIGIEADQVAFQHYDSGVITDGCGTQLDHGVLAVGYGNMDGKDYWKVKNSWGAKWGQEGFVFLQRGVNMCGIGGAMNSYPTVDPKVAPTPAPPAPPPTPPPAPCTFGDENFTHTCMLTCANWCYKTTHNFGQCTENDTHIECDCVNGDYCEAEKTPTSTVFTV